MSVFFDTIKTYFYVAGYIVFLSIVMTMLYGIQKHHDIIFIINECNKMAFASSRFAFVWPLAIMYAIGVAIDKHYQEL